MFVFRQPKPAKSKVHFIGVQLIHPCPRVMGQFAEVNFTIHRIEIYPTVLESLAELLGKLQHLGMGIVHGHLVQHPKTNRLEARDRIALGVGKDPGGMCSKAVFVVKYQFANPIEAIILEVHRNSTGGIPEDFFADNLPRDISIGPLVHGLSVALVEPRMRQALDDFWVLPYSDDAVGSRTVVGLEKKLMVPLGMRDVLASFADMVDRHEDILCHLISQPLPYKISHPHLVRGNGNQGIAVRDHLMDDALIIRYRIFQVQGIAIRPEECSVNIRKALKLLPKVVKPVA